MGLVEKNAEPQRRTFLPSDLRAEWKVATSTRNNLLLVGSSSATHAMLVALKSHLREPLCQFEPSAGVSVPQPTEGTLVLLEVAGLDKDQQGQLFRWLGESEGRVQVISTTSKPLFSLVETGAFLTNLYYRLNVVRMCSPDANATGI